MDCIFCKIIDGEIPSTKVYEDDAVCAFLDIKPTAPVHIIVVPKMHVNDMNDISPYNSILIARIFEAITKIAKSAGLDGGYRVVSNCGEHAGQTVGHLHFHILGGGQLGIMG